MREETLPNSVRGGEDDIGVFCVARIVELVGNVNFNCLIQLTTTFHWDGLPVVIGI
jgi:hypothetical protein